MTAPCQDLVRFADGELEPERAEAFRAHLAGCAACRAALLEAMELGARLGTLRPPPRSLKLAAEPAATPVESSLASAPARRSRPRWRLLAPWAGGLAAAALAAAVLVVFIQPSLHEPRAVNAFAEATTRPYDIRLAYGDAAPYRPTRDELRGAPESTGQSISLTALAALQDRGDLYGLAIGQAWNGNNPAPLVEQLRALAPTPAIRSDRAALEMLTRTNDNVEAVLAELEALRGSDDRSAARAARWNYALLLSRLDLPLSAARAFREIAEDHEPGWAEEALRRAAPEESRAREARTRWDRADAAGEALVTTGAAMPAELIAGVPGLARAYLYDAVRTAPSRERVLAIAPLAVELDRINGQSTLQAYVTRVASLDFHRRAKLAGAYAQLRHQPTAAVAAELTSPSASADTVDIVMGAMSSLHVIPDHLEAYRRMANQTGDPWFALLLAEAEATADQRRSKWLEAEARLRGTQALCRDAAVAYRCLAIAYQLGTLYQKLHRISDSVAVVHDALGAARITGDWGRHFKLLFLLADVERFNTSTAMSRAYAGEVLLMDPKPCGLGNPAHTILAGNAIADLDGRAARRELELSLGCTPADLSAASDLAEIGRLDPQPGDLAKLQGWLTTLRATEAKTPAQRVLADAIEGRLLIERDRAAGTALLERATATAGTLPLDVDAERARTGAFSALVFDAARHADHARVMALVAQELGLALPGSCAVSMVAEDERAIIVVRGADGRDHAAYEAARRLSSPPPTVSDEAARQLDGCSHVQVMAQAGLQGQPRVLPARLPWSYATGAHRGGSPAPRPSSAPNTLPNTLIVANVIPPAFLRLPTLAPHAPDPAGSTLTLSGVEANPQRVLAAMAGAGEIQFHTHALVDLGISNASHLVLSPGLDGSYALTAEAIRGIELPARPMIVLAACYSAQGARYQHAPWSLPHAFLAAGARAVLAAGTSIPDAAAGPFFARVLERVRAGADPAVALRDEQLATLASNPSSWVADVMLFE
jgi:hypothetical protein